jgi:hypothetical protein
MLATAGNNECPTDVIQDFITTMGIPPQGTGKYEVRQQVVKDNELFIAINSYDEEAAAKSKLEQEEVGGGKQTFGLVIAPNGQLILSTGCPLKKADVEKKGVTQRKWFWPAVIGIILTAGIGVTIYFVRKRKAAQTE